MTKPTSTTAPDLNVTRRILSCMRENNRRMSVEAQEQHRGDSTGGLYHTFNEVAADPEKLEAVLRRAEDYGTPIIDRTSERIRKMIALARERDPDEMIWLSQPARLALRVLHADPMAALVMITLLDECAKMPRADPP